MSYRTIVEQSPENIIVMDVFSNLIKERIIYIGDLIDDELANGVIAQLIHLNSDSNDEIQIYINSPGGSIVAGLAIYDVAKLSKSPIKTVCVGMAASIAAVLMLVGDKRCGLKHSRFLLHQAAGGMVGTTEDTRIHYEEMVILQNMFYSIVKEKISIPNLEENLKFDMWFGSKDALENGMITEIL